MGVRGEGKSRWALAVLVGCLALLATAPAALAAEGTGKISGLVKQSAVLHEVIANVNVRVLDASSRKFVGLARTNGSGEYTVEGLAPGSYKVKFEPGHGSIYAPQFYSGKSSFAEATAFAVAEGETKKEINAELNEGGKISGTVTNASKVGLEGIEVVAFQVGGEEFIGEYSSTGAGGKYTLMGLPKGSYTVEFYPENRFEVNLVPQYYNEVSFAKEATPVVVAEGATKNGIDAKLHEGGEISGRVTDAYTHKPLVGAFVSAYGPGAGEEGGNFAETNANGEYTILGLGSGTYKIEFEESGTGTEHITQYYNDEPTFESANLVTANQGSTTPGINAALIPKAPVNTAGPVVSGTPAAGKTLSCSTGSWTGEPKPTFTYAWLRNGVVIAGASASTYVVQVVDQGTGLACKITATNKHASVSAVSNTLTVPAAPPPPPPVPVITLSSTKIVVSGSSARVPIACANATCTGTIELTEQIVVKHRHHGKTRSKLQTVVLARGSYALTAGQSATILVRLTHTGKSALAKARRHRLSATARVSVAGGGVKYVSIVLSEKPKKNRRR